MKALALAAILLLAVAPARADWLEDAWSPATVGETGGPAVTLGNGGVILVLPAVTLEAAHRSGLSTAAAVTAFIERWGQHCSNVIDLDLPARLRVRLSLERRVRGTGWVITDDREMAFVIDYVPQRRAVCVQPGTDGPTS